MTQEPEPIAQSFTARVAAEVRAELVRQKLSHRQFAERVGISQPQISKRLSGELPMDTAELERFAAALGVPIERFLTAPSPASAA